MVRLHQHFFTGTRHKVVLAWVCVFILANAFGAEAPYGLDIREAVAPYMNGSFPPTLPTAAQGWTTVEAFPNLKFQNPTFITFAPRNGRLYVCEREGTIQSFINDPNTRVKSLFLDVRNRCQGWDDCGLLGLAFHPDFGIPDSPNRGYCYVYYQYSSEPVPGPERPPDWRAGRNRLSRFTVPDGSLSVDPNSELVLIDQNDEHIWHNGGGIFFHPADGFLYLSLGDEGGASDNFENTNKIDKDLFSGVIRIDVDRNPARSHPPPSKPVSGTTGNYWIPNDNPFVGVPGALEEFWCIGLRSPHRMTLDPVSGRIWCGDVGQRDREEIDLIERGANYQWTWKEGTMPVEERSRPAQVVGAERPPLYEYGHTDGNAAVIGGYVYRGSLHATDLWGKYIFGDNVSGRIWAMTYDGSAAPTLKELCVLPASQRAYTGLSSFGIDDKSELYLCIMGNNEQADGHIRKLARVSGSSEQSIPPLLSRTGLFSNVSSLTPAAGLIGYGVNSPLWSDGAQKQRWFAVPGANAPYDPLREQIAFAPQGEWKFPSGTVLVKHFDLPVDESTPGKVRRLETRVLVREPSGSVYGVVYKWRSDNSDAELLPSSATEELSIKTAAPVGALAGNDIGAPAAPGSTTAAAGGYDLTGGGADVWSHADQFHFAHLRRSGDFDVRVRIDAFNAANVLAKAGLMVRESLDPGSRYFFAVAFPANGNPPSGAGYRVEYRAATNGDSAAIYPDASFQLSYPNTWLRLRRAGNTFTAFAGSDGVSWRVAGAFTMTLPNDVELGLAVCAHDATGSANAKYRDLANNRGQTWYYPSRSDCMSCHTSTAGYVLGVNTRQLNRDQLYSKTGRSDNQLRTLNHLGLFNPPLDELQIPTMAKMTNVSDMSAPVETRVRSYLDANCSHCHRPNGVRTTMDLRFDMPLEQQNILNGSVSENLGISNARVIAPRDIPRSMMHHRLSASDSTQMPPVGRHVIDQAAIAAVREFIMAMPVASFEKAESFADEQNGLAKIKVSLNTYLSQMVTVNYRVSGTATSGVDYDALPGFVAFQPGETEKEIIVNLKRDDVIEGETLILTLDNAVNASIGAPAVHTLTVADQQQPYVASPITASMNPASVGDVITFTSYFVSSVPLTYTWALGDGTVIPGGASIAYTYSAAGNYLVSVVAMTPDNHALTSEISVLIQSAKPPGNPATLPLKLRKLLGSVRFNLEGKDSYSVAGILPETEIGSFTGLELGVNVGGAAHVMQLNSKGKAQSPGCRAQLRRVGKSKQLIFTALLRGAFASHWVDEGVTGENTVKNAPVPMNVEVSLGAKSYSLNAATLYSSKAYRTGKFRLKF